MNIAAVETWLQEHAGLEASTLGAGVVARAARDRMEALRCPRVEDYLARLAESEEERHTLIDRVVVPETWFFRDRPALEAVARHAVSTWAAARPGATFHVLSVPCSTGEEAYSLAIAFALAGWPLTHLRIDAVDISRENLTRAQAGIYGRNSFRGDDLTFRNEFFEAGARAEWRVAERVRAPVRFAQGNLPAPDFVPGRGPYDAIFCRNLLIYFDRPTQDRAVRALEQMPAPGGWIAVGPAEPVLFFDHGFRALRVPSGFLLERAPQETRVTAAQPQRAKPAPPPPLAPRTIVPPRKPARPAAKKPPTATPAPAAPPEADPLAAIRALADAGQLAEARRRGEALLAEPGRMSAGLFFLLGVIAEAGGDARQAGEFFRKTIYLEPRHAEALAHLALLAEKSGDARAARQLRQRAQRHSDQEVA